MSDLLERAIQAHGGWDRWQQTKAIKAHIAAGGAVFPIKGFPNAYADIHCSIDTRKQHTEFTPFLKSGQHCVFEPGQTSVVSATGEVMEKLESPRNSFAGHTVMTPWDARQLVYFTGYAMWTYLTTPFLFKLPGFKTEEIDPWSENGETWRRLKVTFPAEIHSHSTVQTFYFNADGLLRRHDYSVEIMGGTNSCHYSSDHVTFGGLVFPTKRRVYSIGENNLPVLDRVAISIDVRNVEVI
ncbi:hypothetical protein [Bradyrhizobium sp. USDA 4486]